eukprot:4267710-Alexandrium_andersonii.AAC.1
MGTKGEARESARRRRLERPFAPYSANDFEPIGVGCDGPSFCQSGALDQGRLLLHVAAKPTV